MRDDFAVMILTHGRADKVTTYRVLRNNGYTGKIYFVLDDEDNQKEKYESLYGKENIVIFDKQKIIDNTDMMDNFNIHDSITPARNASWGIAKSLGLKYFLQLDDDYTQFGFRYVKDGVLKNTKITNLDKVFESMICFLEDSGASTVAFFQGGDLIGGAGNKRFKDQVIRKAMNTFFCKTDKPLKFIGTLNEDVNTYTLFGSQGVIFLSICDITISPLRSQTVDGGISDIYRENGTYMKSFYTVMAMPSCTKISKMWTTYQRIHHHIDWETCVPKIISERWKKPSNPYWMEK